MSQGIQNYANHRKMVPGFHYVCLGLLTVNLVWRIYLVVRFLSIERVFDLLLALGLALLAWYVREFPLIVQNRVIRLEEQLRLARLAPDLASRVSELSASQLVGLRFASDDELPALARTVLDEKIKSREEIKKRIRTWRADHLRA
jgi:Family of unknown function (DUF6526)